MLNNNNTQCDAMKLPNTFKEWQAYSANINARARALQASIHEQGWALAATVGIPRCMCSLHNAAIDDNMTGWCHNNPHRLKVAKRADHIVNDFTVSDMAQRITRRAWDHFTGKRPMTGQLALSELLAV